MHEFSVVIIVKGRRKQLANLLDSIRASTVLPGDIQIVFMDEPDGFSIPDGLNVNTLALNELDTLPLAAARNRGIAATTTSNVIFIDVDCIVSLTLFANMLMNLQASNVIAAYPLYLPLLPDSGNYEELKNKAVTHPARKEIQAGQPVHHLQFWSLIFAIQKQTFNNIGGFDESFTGYGAEDTDFAMAFHEAGVEQIFVNDYVLHQYHDKYDPPLNHFNSIIENAVRYQKKWKVLPMQRWLKAFESLGLIEIEPSGQIIVKQQPDSLQLKSCLSANPY